MEVDKKGLTMFSNQISEYSTKQGNENGFSWKEHCQKYMPRKFEMYEGT